MMQVVSEQKTFFARLSIQFGNRLQVCVALLCMDEVLEVWFTTPPPQEHLCKSFNQQATKFMESITQRQPGLSIPSHAKVHNELMVYCDLMHWMEECENDKFVEVLKVS